MARSNLLLRTIFLLSLLAVTSLGAWAQSGTQETARVKKLFEQGRWQEIVNSVHALNSPDIAFYFATAQARLGHWDAASDAFEAGRRLSRRDPRFPVELAGVAFKQKKYAIAEDFLRGAIKLTPNDPYTNEFLATVFFLEGNLNAALKYWNRINKPYIAEYVADPALRLNPVLLDRALAFSPASTLKLADLLTSQAHLDELKIFSASHFELQAREDGTFDLHFQSFERNGCGGKWGCLLTAFGQTPAQTLRFDYYNLDRRAINFESLFRWDSEKMRVSAYLEAPFRRQPKWHFRAGADLRNENWAFRDSFSGISPLLGALNLKRQAGSFEFTDVVSGSWKWSATTELSHRSVNNVFMGAVLRPDLLRTGMMLKQSLGAEAMLLRVPEHRLVVDSFGSVAVARLWSTSNPAFAQFQGGTRTIWLPQHTGDKYELRHTVRAGTSAGSPPFDELFTLGALGDAELLMRAHIATRDGKKGSAPIGSGYFVSNFDATRTFSPIPLLKIKVGPFVDTGWTNNLLAPDKWLWDSGLQARIQLLGFEMAVSYGRDLRSGRNAVLARIP